MLVGALALALATAGCGELFDEPRETPTSDVSTASYQLSRECPDVSTPIREITVDLANAIGANTTLPGWQAADIGASTKLSDDRIVWVFGDTVRDSSMTPRIVANSMLISHGVCVAQLIAPGEEEIIPDVAGQTRQVRWPMSVVRLAPEHGLESQFDDVLVVLTGRIDRGDDGDPFGFEFLGTDAAVFEVRQGGAPQLIKVFQVTPDNRDEHQVNWGAASMVDGDWLYVYGTRQVPTEGVFGRELYVARAPAAAPQERDHWQFWDGTTWQASIDHAAAILPGEGGVSQTLSVDKDSTGRYLAVSKRDGDLGDFVYVWTADRPTGPWRPSRAIEAPAGFDTGELKYAPLAHTEIPLVDGKLLVSISRNTTDLEALLDDPEIGKPVFAEVDVPQ